MALTTTKLTSFFQQLAAPRHRRGVIPPHGVISTLAACLQRDVCSSQLRCASSSSSSGGADQAANSAERMVDLMASSPQMQQMLAAALPPGMRNPEMLKQMFADPSLRKRMADMLTSRGMVIPEHVMQRMNAQTMEQTFAKANSMGLSPVDLFQKLMHYPGLLAKLKEPHVMQAFMDISENPANQAKYADDKETLEVVLKVKEVLGSSVRPPAAVPAQPAADHAASTSQQVGSGDAQSIQLGTGAESEASSAPPPPGTPAQEQPPQEAAGGGTALPMNPLIALMASDPKSAKWLQNPRVMQALQEVQKSPWKTVKYVFDRDVMEAFKDLKELLRGRKP